MTNSFSKNTDGHLEKTFFDARKRAAASLTISISDLPIPVDIQQNRNSIQKLQSERFLQNARRLMKE